MSDSTQPEAQPNSLHSQEVASPNASNGPDLVDDVRRKVSSVFDTSISIPSSNEAVNMPSTKGNFVALRIPEDMRITATANDGSQLYNDISYADMMRFAQSALGTSEHGDLSVDMETRQVCLNGKPIPNCILKPELRDRLQNDLRARSEKMLDTIAWSTQQIRSAGATHSEHAMPPAHSSHRKEEKVMKEVPQPSKVDATATIDQPNATVVPNSESAVPPVEQPIKVAPTEKAENIKEVPEFFIIDPDCRLLVEFVDTHGAVTRRQTGKARSLVSKKLMGEKDAKVVLRTSDGMLGVQVGDAPPVYGAWKVSEETQKYLLLQSENFAKTEGQYRDQDTRKRLMPGMKFKISTEPGVTYDVESYRKKFNHDPSVEVVIDPSDNLIWTIKVGAEDGVQTQEEVRTMHVLESADEKVGEPQSAPITRSPRRPDRAGYVYWPFTLRGYRQWQETIGRRRIIGTLKLFGGSAATALAGNLLSGAAFLKPALSQIAYGTSVGMGAAASLPALTAETLVTAFGHMRGNIGIHGFWRGLRRSLPLLGGGMADRTREAIDLATSAGSGTLSDSAVSRVENLFSDALSKGNDDSLMNTDAEVTLINTLDKVNIADPSQVRTLGKLRNYSEYCLPRFMLIRAIALQMENHAKAPTDNTVRHLAEDCCAAYDVPPSQIAQEARQLIDKVRTRMTEADRKAIVEAFADVESDASYGENGAMKSLVEMSVVYGRALKNWHRNTRERVAIIAVSAGTGIALGAATGAIITPAIGVVGHLGARWLYSNVNDASSNVRFSSKDPDHDPITGPRGGPVPYPSTSSMGIYQTGLRVTRSEVMDDAIAKYFYDRINIQKYIDAFPAMQSNDVDQLARDLAREVQSELARIPGPPKKHDHDHEKKVEAELQRLREDLRRREDRLDQLKVDHRKTTTEIGKLNLRQLEAKKASFDSELNALQIQLNATGDLTLRRSIQDRMDRKREDIAKVDADIDRLHKLSETLEDLNGSIRMLKEKIEEIEVGGDLVREGHTKKYKGIPQLEHELGHDSHGEHGHEKKEKPLTPEEVGRSEPARKAFMLRVQEVVEARQGQGIYAKYIGPTVKELVTKGGLVLATGAGAGTIAGGGMLLAGVNPTVSGTVGVLLAAGLIGKLGYEAAKARLMGSLFTSAAHKSANTHKAETHETKDTHH